MKRFAYACLGVLALAAAFHLGAITALSSTDCIELAEIDAAGEVACLVGSSVIRYGADHNFTTPLPRAGRVVALQPYFESVFVLFADGELWSYYSPANQWQLRGSAACGLTAVDPSTWGRIKAQSRGR